MNVTITDHALIRWLTRVQGVDMEGLRAVLAELAEPYAKLKVQHAEIGGFWFVFDGPKLVTVQESRPDFRQRHKHDRHDTNGSNRAREPMPWQGQKRRRNHK